MGAFLGYAMVVMSFIASIAIGVMGLVKLCKTDNKHAGLVLVQTGVIFVVNIMMSVLALLMMIIIPDFSWWMVICFFLIVTGRVIPGVRGSSYAAGAGACIMACWGKPESIQAFAAITMILAWSLDWLYGKMLKKSQKEANQDSAE